MKKSFVVISALIVLVAFSCAVANSGPANPEYTNLKILPRDITHDQMDSVMHHFTASLNVKCNFCHVKKEDGKEWNYASDANKHKLIARDMMKMTTELNKKYFDLTGAKQNLSTPLMVTCYTCHNGHKEPLKLTPEKTSK